MNKKPAFYFSITALLLATACSSSDKSKPVLSSIDQVASQKYSINADSNATVNGKQGSSFLFPAGSLVDEKDSLVKGKVDIELIEINTIENFIKSGITTQSDGKLLVSDGSYYLNATQNGKPLNIKNGKQVYARFPTALKDQDMKFFSGEKTAEGNVNWKLEENQKPLSEKLPSSLSKRNKNLPKEKTTPTMKMTEAEHTLLFAEYNDLSMYLYDNIYNEETKYVKLGGWYLPEDEADRIVKSKYGMSYSEYRPFNNYNQTEKAKSENIEPINDRDIPKSPFCYRASIVEAREKRFKELNKMLGINQPDKPKNFAKKKEAFQKEENESWESFIHRGDEAYKKEYGVQSYLYAISKFGWMNCDRFAKDRLDTFEGKILNTSGDPIPYATEVHLISRKEKIHLKQMVTAGTFKFEYPTQKPFDIIFTYGAEDVTKTFDGTHPLLDDIKLTIKE
jgi:hypothetical protein